MQIQDLLMLSARNTVRAGTRTVLCVLAICIGITSVGLITAIGNTAGDSIQKELDQIGIRGVAIYPDSEDILSEAALMLFSQSDAIQTFMPLALTAGSARLRNTTSAVGIIGVDEQLSEVLLLQVLHGTLPTKGQVAAGEKILVIDESFARQAYGRTNVVGKSLTLSVNGITETLSVCAVIQSQSAGISALVGGNLPYFVYIPHTTLTKISSSIPVNKILALPEADANFDQLMERLFKITGLTFHYENMSQYLDIVGNISSVLTMLISGVAGISILVGGIGVMNAMFSSIDARTREIGIYRALGAKRRDIIKTILAESVLLCLIGGFLGIAIQSILIFILEKWTGIAISLQMGDMLISIITATICGICVGWIPAIRAANLDPIQAIREE